MLLNKYLECCEDEKFYLDDSDRWVLKWKKKRKSVGRKKKMFFFSVKK